MLRTSLPYDDGAEKEDDRATLMGLFATTNGQQWKKKKNWGSRAALSKWQSVEANGAGRVVKLELSSAGLRGACVLAGVRA